MNDESIQRLLRLKRYEQPPAGYSEDFLREFHYRQLAELLKPSFTDLLLERFSSWATEFRVPAFAYAAATAMAVVASIAILRVNPTPTSSSNYAISYSQSPFTQMPITVLRTQPVSLRVGDDSGSLKIFPTSYLLQARPANNESPLSF